MTEKTKLIDIFNKINDNYNVTICNNGFIVDISGRDSTDEWITGKFVVNTIDELKEVIQVLAWMPRS